MKKLFLVSTVVLALTVAHGQTTFQKTYGGSGDDWGTCIKQTSDGGYIVTGIKDEIGFTQMDNCWAGEAYLVKLNGNGVLQWSKTFASSSFNIGRSVDVTSDGGFIIAGETGSWCPFMSAFSYTHLLKTDFSGNLQWSGTYGYGFSGSPDEAGYSVQQTNDGGYVTAGKRIRTNFGTDYEAYLMKVNSSGTLQWSMVYGDSNNDAGYSISQTTDDGYIIAGTIDEGTFQKDMHLMKDSNGNMLWNKTYDAGALENLISVIQTSDGGFVALGNTNTIPDSDILLLKLASDGTLLWNKGFGGTYNDYASCLKQANDGGFVIAGYTNSFGSTNVNLSYLIKTDTTGNLQWSKTYGGTAGDAAYSVELTNDGGYVLAGATNSFGVGGTDIYIVKTDSLGNSNCNETSPPTIQKTYTITSSSKGALLSSWNLMPISLATNPGSGAIEDSLCLMVGTGNLFPSTININIFPNPFSTQTVLQTDNSFHNATLTVDNCFGQTVAQIKNINGQSIIFNRGNLPSGLYFFRLTPTPSLSPPDSGGEPEGEGVTGKLVITD